MVKKKITKSKRSYKVIDRIFDPFDPLDPYNSVDNAPDFLEDITNWFSGLAKKISDFNKTTHTQSRDGSFEQDFLVSSPFKPWVKNK